MEKEKVIADFLQNQPLYSKVEIDKYYFHPMRFYDQTFQFYCPNENSIQTFKLVLEPEKIIEETGGMASDRKDVLDSHLEDSSIKFIYHYSGQCQYCKKYRANFLLNVFSDGPIPGLSIYNSFQMVGGRGGNSNENKVKLPDHKLFIRKIGQFPAYEIKPDKDIISFFQETDREFYKKALICLSQSFGVAAYAYLRRITENEILRIVESLCEIQSQESEKIKTLYEKYQSNNQMSNLIEGIYQHLPSGLKSLGTNPLKILYAHFSEGLHSEDEETCLQKAFALDTILKFTIKKINEEKYELKDIRAALKNLGH